MLCRQGVGKLLSAKLESRGPLLVNVNISCGYIQEPLVGGKRNTRLLSHGFMSILWRTELIWNKTCSTKNSYKL